MNQSSIPQAPRVWCALIVLMLAVSGGAAQKRSSSSKATKTTKTTAKKEVARKDSKKDSKKESKKDSKKDSKKESKREVAARDAKNKRDAKSDNRRAAKRNDDDNVKSKSKLSKRERLAETRRERARREAERRAEIARREAERREAIRRAEAARQARLAAIRAANQALKDETQANILKDDLTGEDTQVRAVALKALGNRAGSVVVMNPQSGQVYSIVNQEWGVRRGFKPCSTIKLVTGLAGVTYNVIPPVDTVEAGGSRYRLDLTDSLAYSNNPYFQNVGGRVGFDLMMKTASELGLGQPTGINHPNESAGRVPALKSGYAVNHMSSHGDDFAVTPIQLATMTSALVNGGNLLIPHLPRTPAEANNFKIEVRRKISFTKEQMQRLYPGMIGAVNYGTGKRAYDVTQTVGGKTGTCIDNGTWVGLFTSVTPMQNPNLAVTVVLKGSGERGKTAAAVAGEVIRGLNSRFGAKNLNGNPNQIAISPSVLAPRPKINPTAAAVISDEEAEAEAEERALTTPVAAQPTVVPNANNTTPTGNPTLAPNTVRPVLRPIGRPMIFNEPRTTTTTPSSTPSATTPGSTNGTPGKFDKQQRPRRVTDNQAQPNPQPEPQP